MRFLPSILVLSASTVNGEINYQEPGYCGVPVVQPNVNLFTDLPRSSKMKPSDSRYQGSPGRLGSSSSSSSSTNEGPTNRLPVGGPRIQPMFFHQSAGHTGEDVDPEMAPEPVPPLESKQEQVLKNPYADPLAFIDWSNLVRVVGGQQAVPHSWPWQAHLSVCGNWLGVFDCSVCGGTIVSPTHVITAAHCIPENPRGTVILGAHSISSGGVQRLAVKRFTPHPSWNVPSTYDNDIAVLELSEPAIFTDEVSPICLPKDNVCFTEGTPCVVTGWGLTNEYGGFPDDLQETAVKLVDRERCRRYAGYADVTDRMICAGYESGGRDACAGDSGGPLVCKAGGNGPWVLYGVISWGYGCARPGNPGVYAYVPSLVSWIKEQTGLEPVFGMEQCHDGSIDMPEPPPPRTTTKPAPAKVEQAINCDDPAGYGQSHTDSGVIQTAGYPKPYSANQHCYYCVEPASEGSFVEIKINEIQLDQKKNCHKKGDYVYVEPENKPGYYLCQVKRNPKDTHKIVNSGRVCLRFVSDGLKSRAGLSATYKQMTSPPSGCGGDQIVRLQEKSTGQTIKSLNYPEKYPDKVADSCSWLLQIDDQKSGAFKMQLDFAVLQMEKQDKNNKKTMYCEESDSITIYGSTSCEPELLKKAPILYVLCGHYKPKDRPMIDINSQSACVVFKINGDGSRNGNGFHANVNLIRRTSG